MSMMPDPYRGFSYPSDVINEAVWLYYCFSLSLREVELILARRGVEVSYETIRQWSYRFGQTSRTGCAGGVKVHASLPKTKSLRWLPRKVRENPPVGSTSGLP